jgi:hypothetical protein
MMIRTRLMSAALAVSTLMGALTLSVSAPLPAAAKKEDTYRIGTYLGSAATIYALSKGKGTWALIGGGATLLSYNQWKKEASRRRQRDRSQRAYQSYRSKWLQNHRGKRIQRVR